MKKLFYNKNKLSTGLARPQRADGFTLLELLIVVAIIILVLSVILSNSDNPKSSARDSVKITQLQNVVILLEQYRSQCGSYPSDFSSPINAGSPECFGQSFSDYSGSPDVANIQYVALANGPISRCNGYHVGISLEKERSDHKKDDDFNSSSLPAAWPSLCTGSSAGFNGGDDSGANHYYDFQNS